MAAEGRSNIHHPLQLLLALGLLLMFASAPVRAAHGNLRIESPVAGQLELQHALGWERWSPIAAGTTTLWHLPAGEYRARFSPDPPAEAVEIPGDWDRIVVWAEMTVAIVIAPSQQRIHQSQLPDDTHGALLMIEGPLLRALPGDKESILRSLDTHTRWRPGARLDGRDVTIACERREIIPGTRNVLGPSWAALSPVGPADRATVWNLTLEPALALPLAPDRPAARPGWLDLVGSVRQSSYEGREFSAAAHLSRTIAGGADARGVASVRYADLGDASPRATAHGVLPHNDSQFLDIAGRLEIGHPAPLLLRSAPRSDAIGALQGPRLAADGRWGLTLRVASRGWRRNHFLEPYRHNLEHAPYEESALFLADGTCDLRISPRTSAALRLGYDRYLTRLTDGLYRGDLRAYAAGESNGTTDEAGLYWSDGSGDPYPIPHVFDYYQRKLSETQRAAVTLTHAPRARDLLLTTSLTLRRDAYRRYEHFAPAELLAGLSENALAIGYGATGERRASEPFGPGQPLLLRANVGTSWAPNAHWRLDASLGACFFDARDSALVSLEDPRGSNDRLDPGELQRSDSHLLPEASLGLRKKTSSRIELWGLAYRRALPPPLEALYSPRAHLNLRAPEGVMGNPDLAPERETGAELGAALPLRWAGQTLRLLAAGYAGRLDDAITMTYARVQSLTASADTLLATYAGGGTLRRWGLHLEAVLGQEDASGDRFWARLAYDLARIETDHFEPPLLDGRWLYPDRPQGEYGSEGYGSAIGGILDAAVGGGRSTLRAGRYRAANIDRPHRVSLAIVARDPAPPANANWVEMLTRGWTLGVLGRLAAGRPYTQTYLRAAGVLPNAVAELRGYDIDPAWEEVVAELEANAARMPLDFQLDLAVTRRVALGPKHLELRLEAINLLNARNAIAVYRATGEPDDDGCLDSGACAATLPADATRAEYLERLRDPRHYDRPLILRVAVTLELI